MLSGPSLYFPPVLFNMSFVRWLCEDKKVLKRKTYGVFSPGHLHGLVQISPRILSNVSAEHSPIRDAERRKKNRVRAVYCAG